MLPGTGDPITEGDERGKNDAINPWSKSILNSEFSAPQEKHDKLIMREGFSLLGEKSHIMQNNPEEKSENDITLSSDMSESGNSTPGPSPAFLAALSTLGEHSDHMLLPRSLHQIAEAYFFEEDCILFMREQEYDCITGVTFNLLTAPDQWAIQFLHLEMLYHKRLLSNLASMQNDWESHWKTVSKAKTHSPVKIHCTEAETKRISSLSRICRTHQRPNRSVEKVSKLRVTVREQRSSGNSTKMEECTEQLESDPDDEQCDEAERRDESPHTAKSLMKELEEEEATKLIEVEETFPSNGLVSILKKRPEESSPANPSPPKGSSKLKVRFSETDSFLDNDEAGEESYLFFLVLCLLTVAISMGATMLFCFLGGAYSNICTDFSHNVDFFFSLTRRAVDILTHWFIPASS